MDLKILQIENSCTGCGACSCVCPKGCITLDRNKDGFYYPVCDNEKCVGCRLCEKNCHVISEEATGRVSEDAFFMYAGDDNVRTKSSSGGAFYVLASSVLSQNGVVYGSAFDPSSMRLEIVSTSETSLERIQKSKYVESYSGASFARIKNDLLRRREVLFCGTPCQVKGLKHYLRVNKVDESTLITVDFICHGVPSSLCFDEYISRFRSKSKLITNVDFRNKRFDKNGQRWHDLSLRVDFEDTESIVVPYAPPYNLDYYKLFEDGVILRRCCYNCNLPLHSVADFTLADFWGVNNYKPSIDDNKGISIIKMHTSKAKIMWEGIKCNALVFERLPYEAVKYIYNRSNKEVICRQREVFFNTFRHKGYKTAVAEYYGFLRIVKAYTLGWLKTMIKMTIRHYR